MRKGSYSRKRHHDDRYRSESDSSCFSSSLKSARIVNGFNSNTNRKRSRPDYKRGIYSNSTHERNPKRKYRRSSSSSSSKSNRRQYEDRTTSRKSTVKSDASHVEQDENGYLVMNEGNVIKYRYKVMKQLGEGTFGRVVQCSDLRSNMHEVAVKVIRNVPKYREAAYIELKVLDMIKNNDPNGRKLVITALDSFEYHGHIGIVFPLLGPSVFDFLKGNHYCGYPLRQVIHMTFQICKAVQFLHKLKLTHTDLKPENILLINGNDYELQYNEATKRKVKVLHDPSIRIIDLGSATLEDEHHTSVIATRHYRPLEVVLGLGWSYSCDVWSVGCILFELYTGITMFMTHDNLEHLAMMERVLGHLPARMTRRSKKQKYFTESGQLNWNCDSKGGRYVRSELKPLRRYINRPSDIRELDLFDLIEEMLEYNPKKRITMSEALRHPLLNDYVAPAHYDPDINNNANGINNTNFPTSNGDHCGKNSHSPSKYRRGRRYSSCYNSSRRPRSASCDSR